MIEDMPCEFCILHCNVNNMNHCEKLLFWIKDCDNDE